MTLSGMTGFGRAEGEQRGLRWIWEVRSVNGRGLDVKSRLPPGYESLDIALREMAQKRFRRGSIQASLNFRREAASTAATVDHAAVAALLDAGAAYIADGRAAAPRWDGLLQVRGVLRNEEAVENPDERAGLEAALLVGLNDALETLELARRAEGAALSAALLKLVEEIESETAAARDLAAAAPAAMLERIRARLAALAPEVALDAQRVAQEAALAAARADIREELDRLAAHAAEARALIAGAAQAGRRLDFLAQEFNREANTLCAKSNDLALTRAGLNLKTAIDQFREQSANVE